MGKTKTAFIGGTDEDSKDLSGAEKYKIKAAKKAAEEAKEKAAVQGVGLKGGERIKVIGGDVAETTPSEDEQTPDTKKTSRTAKVRGKKYVAAKSKFDKTKEYTPENAIKLLKDIQFSKFDGTVELHAKIGKTGFSETITLPHSFGKEKKIEVASDKTIEKLKTGKIDFDTLLATAEMMPKLVPFAKLLGPRGLMPNPKNGTLIKSEKEADKFSASSMTIKTEKDQPVIHTVVGKVSQSEKELLENLNALIDVIDKKKVVRAHLAASMSPSVKLKV